MGEVFPFERASRDLGETYAPTADDDVSRSPLQHGGGSGTLPPMDLVDAKIATAEARTDTKFAQVRADLAGDFGELKAELAKKPGTGTLVGTAIAIVAILLSVLALAANRFDAGMSTTSAVQSALAESSRRNEAANDAFLKRLNEIADQQHRLVQENGRRADQALAPKHQ